MNSHESYESPFEYEDTDSGSDSDENMDVMEKSSKKYTPPWSQLPPLVIEKIYSFLNRQEQRKMSLVCHNWYNEYSYPSLWRRLKFYLPEHEYSAEIYPEVLFARKYGTMFYHVEIICKRVRLHLLPVIWKQLKYFLQAVTSNSQLLSISLINLGMYFRHLDDLMFDDVYQTIMNLLLVQNKLQSIEIRNAQFKKLEAAELLRVIFLKSSKTLKRLLLSGFVSESTHDEVRDNVMEAGLNFDLLMNLEVWTVDYSQIFENIMTTLYECGNQSQFQERKGNLEKMQLFCDGSKRVNYFGIPSAAWKYFRRIFPNLSINLIFHAKSTTRNPIHIFIVRHMPVRSLDFRWDRHNGDRSDPEIGTLLGLLTSCGINESLEELSIVWSAYSTNFAPDIIQFLQLCPKLKVLQVCIQHPVEALDTVFNTWLENGLLSLEVVHITIANVHTTEDAANYSTLEDDYAPLLQVLGLNLILIADSNIRPVRRGGVTN